MIIESYEFSDKTLLESVDFDVVCPSYEILYIPEGEEALKKIEGIARDCYKSHDRITEISYIKMVKMLKNKGHMSMFEFGDITVRFLGDIGVCREIRTHRIASHAQESTRYCDYNGRLSFIKPKEIKDDAIQVWLDAMKIAVKGYRELRNFGYKPEIARCVLPLSTTSILNVKANFSEWIHILSLRTHHTAHPLMRDLMTPLLKEFQNKIPIIFDNL